MSEGNGHGLPREALREALQELLPGLVQQALAEREPAAGPSGPAPVPQVPPPPVAAVHRPAGWPGTTTGTPTARPRPEPAQDGPPRGSSRSARWHNAAAEEVSLASDADLDAFVRRLLALFENPRDRLALRSGQLRFRLRAPAGQAASQAQPAPAQRIERGAVTERVVDEAARAGARLVLGPRAVLTPLGRDRARTLGIEVERERRC